MEKMKDGQRREGGTYMIDEKKKNVRYEETRKRQNVKESKTSSICPVCGKNLSQEHQPGIESVIEEDLYYHGRFRIMNSEVTLVLNFSHYYDEEEDRIMENPHELTAVIKAEFDDTGTCTAFYVVEIRPARKEESLF